MASSETDKPTNWAARVDLAAAFQSAARLDWHEAVANHFSVAVNSDGSRFLINPNQKHFALIRASDLLELDANDPATLHRPDAPDLTAWGLHGSLHRLLPHARCILHVHSPYATALACLQDSALPPIDQNSAMFYQRYAIDKDYGGLAFESEGIRCAELMKDSKIKVLIMGNHGVLVLGHDVADAFNRLYYFERAARNYLLALQTGQALQVISHDVALKTATELDDYPDQAERHFADRKTLLDRANSDYAE